MKKNKYESFQGTSTEDILLKHHDKSMEESLLTTSFCYL